MTSNEIPRRARGATGVCGLSFRSTIDSYPNKSRPPISQAENTARPVSETIRSSRLLVWPDQSPSWENMDRYPASEPRAAAWQAFRRLDELTADAAGAATDEFAPVPYLRFEEAAQSVFNDWRKDFETQLRSGDLAPALESHLAKYRKLVPALALINHLAGGGVGAISETAILRALAFAEYLETHARRAYGAGSEVETSAAKAILKHIRKGNLQDGFTAREIQRRGWSNLSDCDHVRTPGLDCLAILIGFVPKGALPGQPEAVQALPCSPAVPRGPRGGRGMLRSSLAGTFLATELLRLDWRPEDIFDRWHGLDWFVKGKKVTALGARHAFLEDGRLFERTGR